jgi:hypothetical protein
MRWKEKHIETGTERIVQRFLWFPLCINREWRWLEVAFIKQRYFRSEAGTGEHGWNSMEWTAQPLYMDTTKPVYRITGK